LVEPDQMNLYSPVQRSNYRTVIARFSRGDTGVVKTKNYTLRILEEKKITFVFFL